MHLKTPKLVLKKKKKVEICLGNRHGAVVKHLIQTWYGQIREHTITPQTLILPLLILLLPVLSQNKSLTSLCAETTFNRTKYFILLPLNLSSSTSSPLQRPTLCHCGHQPPPVEPGLRHNPTGLSGGEGWAKLLGDAGLHGGDGSYISSAAASQSHVPEQLRRPAQPGAQGMRKASTSSRECVVSLARCRVFDALTLCKRAPHVCVTGAGHSLVAEQPAQSVRGGLAQCDRAAQGERHSEAAQSAANRVHRSDHVGRHAAHRAVQPQR